MNALLDPVLLGRRALSAVALGVLLGCSAMPIAPVLAQSDQTDSRSADGAPFDGDLMYELLIAELAGRRGKLDVAMKGYLAATERSDDKRVADRAARLAMFSRRWAEAERAASRWVELDPEARDGREVLARALLMQGKSDAAADAYVALVDMSPATTNDAGETQADATDSGEMPDADALADGTASASMSRKEVLRGLVATLQGEDPSRAAVVVDALVEAFPEEAEAHLGKARIALASNDREVALSAVDAALEREPANADGLLLRARILIASGRADEAFAELDHAVEVTPGDVSLQLGQAQLLAEAGRIDTALAAFEQLHDLASDNADVLLTIGLLALDADRPEPAQRYLESLLETGEYADQTHFYLARIDDAAGEYDSAIEHYRAVQPGQLYADARIRAAELQAIGGDLEGGRTGLRDLAAELPDPALAPRLSLAEARMLQQAGRADEAVVVLSDALERFPEDGNLLYARALAADGAGTPEVLEQDLARLIEMEPDNAHALNALGYHLADEDRELDRAANYLEKAVKLEPDDAAILDSLGWLRYRQGALEEAADLLRRALDLYPDGEIAAHLGEVLWMQGNEQEARIVWDAALIEAPNHEVLLRIVKKFVE